MLRTLGDVAQWELQLAVGVLTAIFTAVMSNVGATVVMVPLAVNVALASSGNPTEYALIVALSASNNFITASNPVLAIIAGPGGYRTMDLLRVGGPLSLIYLIIVVAAVNVMF